MKKIFSFSFLFAAFFLSAVCFTGCGKDGKKPEYSLDGVWRGVNWVITISGSTAVVSEIISEFGLATVEQGFVSIGDDKFKNITKTGEKEWSVSMTIIYYYSETTTIDRIEWLHNVTIVLSDDGNAFTYTISENESSPQTYVYTRVKK